MKEPANRRREITGRHVLLGMIGFFGLIIGVNLVFVKMAVQSFPGETTEKSYYQGLNFNEVLIEKARQQESGWRMQLLEIPGDGRTDDTWIDVKLVGADGTPVFGAVVSGRLSRPTTETGLVMLEFDALPGGVYRGRPGRLDKGAWDLALDAREDAAGASMLSAETRIFVE